MSIQNNGEKMSEFTAVLNDDGTFDIFLDGERCYFGFDAQDLKEFAQDFIESSSEVRETAPCGS
jgi:hypothetical protein